VDNIKIDLGEIGRDIDWIDRLCGLVVRVLGYRFSTTEELLDKKVAAHV
jgi:hypothetical protein